MQAIEFEATVEQHTIRVPDHIPDGVALRVLLLVEDSATSILTGEQWKALLTAMPDVGQDEDFARRIDYGREQAWDI